MFESKAVVKIWSKYLINVTLDVGVLQFVSYTFAYDT